MSQEPSTTSTAFCENPLSERLRDQLTLEMIVGSAPAFPQKRKLRLTGRIICKVKINSEKEGIEILPAK